MQPKNSEEMRLYAMGYLWDKTQGKASQEAMRSFSEGAALAFELMTKGNNNEETQQKERAENGANDNE